MLELNEWQMAAGGFAAVLTENLLRGVQNKNVAAGYRKAIFFTGAMMTLCDGLVMTIVAVGGLAMLPYTVAGSALGWSLGPVIHDYLTRKHRDQLKAAKKAKKREKWLLREARLINKLKEVEDANLK